MAKRQASKRKRDQAPTDTGSAAYWNKILSDEGLGVVKTRRIIRRPKGATSKGRRRRPGH